MKRKFWPVFMNWLFVIFENYLSFRRPLAAIITRNPRNMYEEMYQTYNVSKISNNNDIKYAIYTEYHLR